MNLFIIYASRRIPNTLLVVVERRNKRHAVDLRREGSRSHVVVLGEIVVVELVKTTREGSYHEQENEQKFGDIDQHVSKRDLQRSQLFVNLVMRRREEVIRDDCTGSCLVGM